MRYVIVSVIKGEAGDFNNNLRKEVYEKFKAKSSKLPAHFTIKAPFEYDDDITEIEKSIEDYCIQHRREPLETSFPEIMLYKMCICSSDYRLFALVECTLAMEARTVFLLTGDSQGPQGLAHSQHSINTC